MAQFSAAVIGSTGLVGSQILQALGSNSAFTVHAIARKQPPAFSNVSPIIEGDSSKWAASYAALTPAPGVFFSALGTTRANAGGLDKQRLIDFDLNLELAKQAKESGTRVYVLISSASASSGSMFPYTKMKGELEDEVSKLGFDHTVILRPGLLLGRREESRPPEYAIQLVARALGRVSKAALTDPWAQDVDEIGKAAVKAGQLCMEQQKEKGVWIVDQKQILELARSK